MKKLLLLMLVGLALQSSAMEQVVQKVKVVEEQQVAIVISIDKDKFPASVFLEKIIEGAYDKGYKNVPKDIRMLIASYVLFDILPFIESQIEVPSISFDGNESGDCKESFNRAGDRVVVTNDEVATICSVVDGSSVGELAGHEETVCSVSFNRVGDKLITSSVDETVRIWLAKDGSCLHVLRGHEDCVNLASFTSTGDKVVTASDDGTARIWLVEDGSCVHVLTHEGRVNKASFNSRGDRVLTVSDDG